MLYILYVIKEKNYRELKESIRLKKSQRRDTEKIKEGNKIRIDEVIKHN